MSNLELDIDIRHEKDEYVAELFVPLSLDHFRWPIPELGIAEFTGWWSGLGAERDAEIVLERAQNVGSLLFQTLFRDDAKALLRSHAHRAREEDETLRIRLGLGEVPELLELPFEYLHDEALGGFLFLSDNISLVRYFASPRLVPRLAIDPPLQVLAVISGTGESYVDRRLKELKYTFAPLIDSGLMKLDVLVSPTLSKLHEQLQERRYNVLHYVGHVSKTFEDQTAIMLNDDDQQAYYVYAEQFRFLFSNFDNLRLVILDARERHERYGSSFSPLSRFAYELIRSDIPAVVTTQFPLMDAEEITFLHEFYSALLKNYSLDSAIARARIAISRQGPGLAWGAPILYSSSSDLHIFDLRPVGKVEAAIPAIEADETTLELYSAAAREEREVVRNEPARYVGSTDEQGLHRLVYEVVESSMDEVKAGYCDTINVSIHADDSISVTDNGRGLEVEKTTEEGITPAELAIVRLARRIGVDQPVAADVVRYGPAVVNFLSERFELTIWRSGITYEQKYLRGKPTSELKQTGTTRKIGTSITFKPDLQIFGQTKINLDTLSVYLREKAILNSGLRITIRDERRRLKRPREFYYRDPVSELVKALNSRNHVEQLDAIRLLGDLHDTKATRPLLDLLRRTDRPSKKRSIDREIQSVELLITLAQALGKTGDPRAIAPLVELLEKEKRLEICRSAALALGQIGGEDAIAALKKTAGSSNAALAESARAALTQLGLPTTSAQSETVDSAVSRMRNAYALIIGIDDYDEPNLKLRFTVRDAKRLGEVLTDPNLCGYPAENVRMLFNRDATYWAILTALKDLHKRAGPDSTILFYFGGHASDFRDTGYRDLGLMPVDFSNSTRSPIIFGAALTEWLKTLKTKSTLVVLDCSHAGLFNAGPTWTVMGSAGEKEVAYESEQSSFTHRLIEGFMGEVASSDGLIRVFDLYEYVQRLVTRDFPNQHPVLKAEPGNNFPVALRAGGKVYTPTVDLEGFLYDVYISFADQGEDAEWVRKQLIPQLNQASLSVAISHDVEADEDVRRMANAQRGIKPARRTLIVLSPRYLNEELTKFETALSQTFGLESSSQRLVIAEFASVESSRLPPWLQQKRLQWHGEPSSSGPFFERLIEELKKPGIKEPLARLAPDAEAAFLWAEDFRQKKGTPELYSEYLLAALYFAHDGPTRRLLTAFDDPDEIEIQLIKFANQMSSVQVEPDKVSPVPPESLLNLPLSSALKKSLDRAAVLASERGELKGPDRDTLIDENSLLAGLLAEPSNQVGAWISQRLQVPRETLIQIIDETRAGELPLKRIWHAGTRRAPLKLSGHESNVTAVAFSIDGRLVFSGDDTGRLRAWDAETLVGRWQDREDVGLGGIGLPVPVGLRMQKAPVQSIICGRSHVIVGWRDGYVSVFNQRLDTLIHSIRTDQSMSGSNGGLTAMALMRDGRVLLAHQNGTLSIWMAGMEDLLKTLDGHSAAVTDVVITPYGRAVSVSLDRSLRVWDLESGNVLRSMSMGKRLTKVVLTPDGSRAILGAEDGTLTVWDLESGSLLFFPEAHSTEVSGMALTGGGRRLVTTSKGGTLRVWDPESREELLGRDNETVMFSYNALAVAPDGRTLVTGTDDGTVRLWDQASLISALPEIPGRFCRMHIRASSNTVVVGQSLVLEVSVVADQAGKGTFELADDLGVLSCFISVNDNGLRISGSEAADIHRDEQTGEFMPISFDLRAYLRGMHSYSIQLFVEDSTSGKTSIYEATERITVTPPQLGEARRPMLPSLDVRVAPQADFVLQVATDLLEDGDGPRELIYSLSSRLPNLRLSNEDVGRVSLRAGELGRLRTLLLSTLQSCTGLQPEDSRKRLVAFGVYLFDRLFPVDQAAAFRDAYWKVANQLTTWLFIEDGVTWLPWELLVPHRDDQEDSPPRFLGECFQLSRWVELGPALYSEVPLGEIALAHYKPPELEKDDEDLSAWKSLLNAPASSGITELVKQETPFYRLHLLRYARNLEQQEIVARDSENITLSSDEDARRARLDLRLKRPIVSLSILDAGGLQAELGRDWPLPDRVMPFLRAGASAVVGPWWPTSEAADRIFWLTFYDLVERRVSLGEAVWRSRLAVERGLPQRPDWLAYTLFGDTRARGYEPELSEGYTTLERLYSDKPLRPGQTCYFRASISRRPSFIYQDRLVKTDELPKEPLVLFLAPGVQQTIPDPIEMKPVGRNTVEAIYTMTVKEPGPFLLTARLYDGEERLQSLQLPLVVESE